ncbi:MAG TPA: phage holin family protein, partial [Bacteroidia bacterium]|nr:phage holin family protein [Bacteroidia bacterium]
RSCDLCIKVSNMPKHATMVSFSGMYLIYCDCISRTTNEKITIVAALTNGDIDNLVVGKNALFYDRKGLDWDATVVKIVDNPISIRQAFFSPYRKVSRFIENQVNKFATTQDEKVTTDMNKSVEGVPAKVQDTKTKKEPPPPFDVGKFVGIFAAIGLAVGAIGTALAAVVAGFMGLVWWKMPIALAGIVLLISGPSMIIAYLKLRKRNLAPILDANGWAINARAVVNIHFGNTLTHLAELPKGSKINLNDPFTKKKRPLLPAILILLTTAALVAYLLWKYGFIHIPRLPASM